MKKRNFITQLHLRTKRNYKKRMFTNKVLCMKVAKKYGKDYWDRLTDFQGVPPVQPIKYRRRVKPKLESIEVDSKATKHVELRSKSGNETR